MNAKLFKRSAVAITAGSLLVALSACSDDDKDAVSSAASDAGSAASSAAGAASSALNSSDENNTSAETTGPSETAEDGAAASAELPEAIKAAYDEAGGEHGSFGAVKNVEASDGKTLATFENGWIVGTPDHGAVPLIGKIGETWADGGGLTNELGAPTAAETGDASAGWSQTFEAGTINWVPDASGQWNADIQKAGCTQVTGISAIRTVKLRIMHAGICCAGHSIAERLSVALVLPITWGLTLKCGARGRKGH